MAFSRDEIDSRIDQMIQEARSEQASPESIFMIDAPLREYIVAVEQIKSEGGAVDDICDSSVMLVCSMISSLAATMPIKAKDESAADAFIAFCNIFMQELAKTVSDVVNKIEGKNAFVVTRLDPNRIKH